MKPSPQAFRSAAAIHRAGLAADRPEADDVLAGTLYFSTDSGVLERSDGASWAAYSAGGGGLAPSVTEGQLLGRGSTSGDGPAEEINPGEYISLTGTEVDVAGAGATSFIVQSLAAARAEVAGLGKAPGDYLPNAQEMALLPSGYVTNTTGTGVLGATPTIPAAALPPTIAYTDRANRFTQDQTVAKAVPVLTFSDAAQPANARNFNLYAADQLLVVNATDDPATSGTSVAHFTRAGDAVISRDVYEKHRPVPMGHWQAVPFTPANFIGTPAWTGLTAAQVPQNQYTVIGKTLHWTINLAAFALTGAAGTPALVIPGGAIVATGGAVGTFVYLNPATSGTWGMGFLSVGAGATSVQLIPLPSFQWLAGTNNYAYVNVTLPIQ